MELKERLQKFIHWFSAEEVKNGRKKVGEDKFAEMVGMSKGSISHLNKALRTDTVTKIHEKFPELNMMWLLFEKGEMLCLPPPSSIEERIGKIESELTEIKKSQREKIERLEQELSFINAQRKKP